MSSCRGAKVIETVCITAPTRRAADALRFGDRLAVQCHERYH
jgi:hypothetical protein